MTEHEVQIFWKKQQQKKKKKKNCCVKHHLKKLNFVLVIVTRQYLSNNSYEPLCVFAYMYVKTLDM